MNFLVRLLGKNLFFSEAAIAGQFEVRLVRLYVYSGMFTNFCRAIRLLCTIMRAESTLSGSLRRK
jgi:hypothetical protein